MNYKIIFVSFLTISLSFLITCGKSEMEKRIKNEVNEQLLWDARVNSGEVNVSVSGHEVTLSGRVSDYDAIEAAETDAWLVNGVFSVDNDLVVEYPSTITIPEDEEIEKRIEDMVLWDPIFDSIDVTVEVEDGEVTLTGTVDSYWKKLELENKANNVMGVLSVDNQLAVVPTEKIEDELIAKDIVNSLKRNRKVDAEAVDVRVEDAEVELDGIVDSYRAREAAFDTALHTNGVKTIDNDIIVSY